MIASFIVVCDFLILGPCKGDKSHLNLILSFFLYLKALDRGAAMLKVDKVATGHNADDIAETVLLNILRGDIARYALVISNPPPPPPPFFLFCSYGELVSFVCRLSRCTAITTGEDGPIPRCKPFKYTYEKEIVIYPFLKKLKSFCSSCKTCYSSLLKIPFIANPAT